MGEQVRNQRSGEVAAALGLSAATVQSYARNNRIPHRVTPGGQYRFNFDEVREVLGLSQLEPRVFESVFTGPGVVVDDALSAYRPDPVTGQAASRLRSRAVRPAGPVKPAAALSPSDGAKQFTELVRHARGAAVAVLHR